MKAYLRSEPCRSRPCRAKCAWIGETKTTTAIITGASRGIGAAIASALSASGVAVAVNYNHDHRGARSVVKTLRNNGGRSIAVRGDVSRPLDAQRIASASKNALGPVEILVNNAAYFPPIRSFLESTDADWDRAYEVNLKGAVLMARAVLPMMVQRRSGVILNISSLGAHASSPGYAAYCSSKAALEALTRSLAAELGSFGIRVIGIAPGHIDTPGNLDEQTNGGNTSILSQRIPSGRFGSVDEVASLAVFLTLGLGGYVNGQTVVADGGLLARQVPLR